PSVNVVRLEEVDRILGEPDEVVGAVMMRVLGDMTGRTVQIFPAAAAERLATLMLGETGTVFPDDFDEVRRSMLKEVGNIIVGAYLSALSEFMGMVLIMSVPAISVDMAGAVLSTSFVNFD